MKINITKTTKMPIEIGELNFTIDFSDEKIFKLSENFQAVVEDLKDLNSNNLEDVKSGFRKTLDLFLEEGSFDIIYEKYPSVEIILDVVQELALIITKELEKRGSGNKNKELIENYLKKNNK